MQRRPAEVLKAALAARSPMVFSVHHTGTVFLLDALQWHGAIDRVREMAELCSPGAPPPTCRQVVHLHLMGHCADSRGPLDIPWPDLMETAIKGRVLIPLRDPMLALISRERRLPGGDHRFIVNGFIALLDLLDQVPHNRWLQVDNDWNFEARLAKLNELQAAIGLDPQPFARRLAREWLPQNAWGSGFDLVRLYSIGDLDGLRSRFPMNFDYLTERAKQLRPFLERFGYRDLPWWRT